MAPETLASPVVTTAFDVPGRRVAAVLGIVFGITVRTGDIGSKLAAGLRGWTGGEIPEYTQVAHAIRAEALARLVSEAKRLGADAVVGMRFDSSELGPANTEVFAYGTAVRLEKADRARRE
jgi:uncharacterized protein YbjQ (UPF0145 family)